MRIDKLSSYIFLLFFLITGSNLYAQPIHLGQEVLPVENVEYSEISTTACSIQENSCPKDLGCYYFRGMGFRCAERGGGTGPCDYFKCPENSMCTTTRTVPGYVRCLCLEPHCPDPKISIFAGKLTKEVFADKTFYLSSVVFAAGDDFPITFLSNGDVQTKNLAFMTHWRIGPNNNLQLLTQNGKVEYDFIYDEETKALVGQLVYIRDAFDPSKCGKTLDGFYYHCEAKDHDPKFILLKESMLDLSGAILTLEGMVVCDSGGEKKHSAFLRKQFNENSTVSDVVKILGPGYLPQGSGTGTITWYFDDGSKIITNFSPESLNAKVRMIDTEKQETDPFYVIHDINTKNLPPGNYVTEGYVLIISKCSPCPHGAVCETCLTDHIGISENLQWSDLTNSRITNKQLILFPTPNKPIHFEKNKKYKFFIYIPSPLSFSEEYKYMDSYSVGVHIIDAQLIKDEEDHPGEKFPH